MHAYLLVGIDGEEIKNKSHELAKKLRAKVLEFPLVKIEDVRSLNSFLTLSTSGPTLITIYSIHEATHEALNAFLKNLEEPQKDLFFALSAPSERMLLPTIVSRCQIVRVKDSKKDLVDTDSFRKFIEMTRGEKLMYVDKIKDRKDAIEFTENLISFMSNEIKGEKVDYLKTGANIETVQKCFGGLKSNGNVSLQLTNLVVNFIN